MCSFSCWVIPILNYFNLTFETRMSSKDSEVEEGGEMMPVFESSRTRRLGFLRDRSDSEEMISNRREFARTGRSQSESKAQLGSTLRDFTSRRPQLPSPGRLKRGGVQSAPPTITPMKKKHEKNPLSYVIENVKAPKLPAEVEKGNMEYKLQLMNKSEKRMKHLVTQLQWRLLEGYNEAIYQIGVTDDGDPVGLTKKDLNLSLMTLYEMARQIHSTPKILHVRKGTKSENHYVAEVLIRQFSSTNSLLEIRVAVIGGVASGKSTLIGVLTKGVLDNGFGGARMSILRHQHELESGGRTSAISHHVLGFDTKGT